MATTTRIAATTLDVGESAVSAKVTGQKAMTLTATVTKIGTPTLMVRVGIRGYSDKRPIGDMLQFDATGSQRLVTDAISGDVEVFAEVISGKATVAVVQEVGSADAIELADLPDGVLTADATGRAKMADNFVNAAKIEALAVTTAKVAAGGVTPAKQAFTGFKTGVFVGRNGAGAITLTGAAVGDRLVSATEVSATGDDLVIDGGAVTAQPNAAFEGAITVVNEIQQASASDLSTKKYLCVLAPAAA